MNERPIFSTTFKKRLQADGLSVKDLEKDIRGSESKNPGSWLRQITGYSNTVLAESRYNPVVEETLPRIKNAITDYLESSLEAQNLTLKQLSRITDISPIKIENLIARYGITIGLNGSTKDVALTEGKVSPKRVIKRGRYESRPPGGGPVQRARIQSRRLETARNRLTQENQTIVFQAKQTAPTFVVKENGTPQSVIEVINWFRQQRRRKWLRGTDETGLAKALIDFSQGKPTDFVMWNCFKFEWKPNKNPNERPLCIVTNKLDTSLVLYFQERIKQTAEKLSWLGKPSFTVLIPSSEANYSDVWNYQQSPEERQRMTDSAVVELNKALDQQLAPLGIKIKATRWDDYLLRREITKTPYEYSVEGDKLIRQLPNFRRIQQEAVRNEISYFKQRGITVSKKLVAENGIKYYGVYCGEGMGLLDIQKGGRNVVMINLEEFRVNEMTALGSNNQIPIVTPASHSEMMKYYGYQNTN